MRYPHFRKPPYDLTKFMDAAQYLCEPHTYRNIPVKCYWRHVYFFFAIWKDDEDDNDDDDEDDDDDDDDNDDDDDDG